MRAYVWVRPSVRLSVCPRACSCVQMFVRTCVRSSMHSFVCVSLTRPSVRPAGRLSVCQSACMFVRPNVCSYMRAFINTCATFLISNFLLLTPNFLLLTSIFVLGCLPPYEHVCVYVYPFVRMYLSASCVRVSMLAFVWVHAHEREGVCVSPSVCLSVCLSACMFVRSNVCSYMRAFVNACATFLISNFLLLTSNFLLLTSNF